MASSRKHATDRSTARTTSRATNKRRRFKGRNDRSSRFSDSQRGLKLETLEKRELLAGDIIPGAPRLVSVEPNGAGLLSDTSTDQINVAPTELTFRFDGGVGLDASTLGGIQIIGSGGDGDFTNGNENSNIKVGFLGVVDTEGRTVAMRFAETLPDDQYRISISGVEDPLTGQVALLNESGLPFRTIEGDTSQEIIFDLETGAKVIAVVPQPIDPTDGALTQRANDIDVYFDQDELLTSPSVATPDFYQLIDNLDTVDPSDDVVVNPTSVVVDAANRKVTLQFGSPIDDYSAAGNGTLRLRIGNAVDFVNANLQQVIPGAEPGMDAASAEDLSGPIGTATGSDGSWTLSIEGQEIRNSTAAGVRPLADNIGGTNDVGARDVPPISQFLQAGHVNGVDFDNRISTVVYSFYEGISYGNDGSSDPLFNQASEDQKERFREVLALYSSQMGIQFVESPNSGVQLIVGDLAVDGGTSGPLGQEFSVTTGRVLLDFADFSGSDVNDLGESFFLTAQTAVGFFLGLNPAPTVPGTILAPGGLNTNVYPSVTDVLHGQRLYQRESLDVDLYEFDVPSDGTINAQTFAERLDNASLLDSRLSLFQQTSSGLELIASNDNYFGNDSLLEVAVEAGETYFIGVSANGNNAYNPDSGVPAEGGLTEGRYDLRINFTPELLSVGSIVDSGGSVLDGDMDGNAGGEFNFWFETASTADTIYVRKPDPGADVGGDGSLAAPFDNIDDALAVAATKTNSIVRVLGNDGPDNDITTVDDNEAYEIGRIDSLNQTLDDGRNIELPGGTALVVDAGAILKFLDAAVTVGSQDDGVDRSGSSIQVFGVPGLPVHFTSYNDPSKGINTNPIDNSPTPGDWGGIEIRNDVDLEFGRDVDEQNGSFVSSINHAEMTFGGGQVSLLTRSIDPISLTDSRAAVTYNTITDSANAAVSANPNTFGVLTFNEAEFQTPSVFLPDYDRVGPSIHGNVLNDNTVNGLFVRISTDVNGDLEMFEGTTRFDDTDIVHTLSENVLLEGNPGGPIEDPITGDYTARPSASLIVDPRTIIKSSIARIELGFGATLIAEGRVGEDVIFTARQDDRYGAGGTFDTNGDASGSAPNPGSWAGIYASHTSSVSIDQALIAYGGGITGVEGTSAAFNALEIHQANARVANTTFESNADGQGGQADINREGRLRNAETVIYVNGAQPVFVNNTFIDNGSMDGGADQSTDSALISIDVNSLDSFVRADGGRQTGLADRVAGVTSNVGPLFRGNTMAGNEINGLVIRGGNLQSEIVFDDTDITHVVTDNLIVDNHHHLGGLRLQSNDDESLVVKFTEDAEVIASGRPLDIDDRIGGRVQILGTPGNPVVMTALTDCTIGGGFTPDGLPMNDTLESGLCSITTRDVPFADVVILMDESASMFFAQDFSTQFLLDIDAGLEAGGIGVEDIDADGIIDANRFGIAGFGASDLARRDGIAFPVGPGGELFGTSAEASAATSVFVDDGVTEDGLLAINFVLDNYAFRPLAEKFIILVTNEPRSVIDPLITQATTQARLDADGVILESLLFVRPETGAGADALAVSGSGIAYVADGSGGFTIESGGQVDPASILPGFPGVLESEQVYIDTTYNTGGIVGDLDAVNAGGVQTASFSAAVISSIVTSAGAGTSSDSGEWTGITLDAYSNDRNVDTTIEAEGNIAGIGDTNSTISGSQRLGTLAPNERSGDETSRLGFTVHGNISAVSDQDIYEFSGTPGSLVWIDIDRTDPGLDTVVEFLDGSGEVLALSDNSRTESISGNLPYVNPRNPGAGDAVGFESGEALPMTLSVNAETNRRGGGVVDAFSLNDGDAGMRVVLPGSGQNVGKYYIRVRSSNDRDLTLASEIDASLEEGTSKGAYQLQVRLREQDEVGGSVIRYSDIRFATDAITVTGLPAHSPLTGEVANPGGVIDVGSLANTDRAAISAAGTAGQAGVAADGYQFNVSRDGDGSDVSVTFDVDFADGLSRPNTGAYLYNGAGQLIAVGTDSNIVDDRVVSTIDPTAEDLDVLDSGSYGPKDPFIGPIELTQGGYEIVVANNQRVPVEYSQFTDRNSSASGARFEPIDSVERISDDRFGTAGPVNGDTLQVSFADDGSNAVPYQFGDIALIASSPNEEISVFNPFTGRLDSVVNDDNAGGPDNKVFTNIEGETPIVFDNNDNSYRLGLDGVYSPATDMGTLFFNNATDVNAQPVQLLTNIDGYEILASTSIKTDTGSYVYVVGQRPAFDGSNLARDANNNFVIDTGNPNTDRTAIFRVNPDTGQIVSRNGADMPDGIQSGDPVLIFNDSPTDNRENIPSHTPWTGTNYVGQVAVPDNVNSLTTRRIGGADYVLAFTEDGNVLSFPIETNSNRLGYDAGDLDLSGGARPGIQGTNIRLERPDPVFPAFTTQVFDSGGAPVTFTHVFDGPEYTNPDGVNFADLLFGFDNTDRRLYAFEPVTIGSNIIRFETRKVFAFGSDHVNLGTGVNNLTKFQFSQLSQSLWHVSDEGPVDGHGSPVNTALSRGATDGDFALQFGYSEDLGDGIFNGYNFLGGAHGVVHSNPIDLSAVSEDDLPTLYFNYLIDTESITDGDFVRDSLRVFVSGEDSEWSLVATNNFADNDNINNLDFAEADREYNPNVSNYGDDTGDRRFVSQLFETGEYRQARVELGPWAGQENVQIRFEFATSGEARPDQSEIFLKDGADILAQPVAPQIEISGLMPGQFDLIGSPLFQQTKTFEFVLTGTIPTPGTIAVEVDATDSAIDVRDKFQQALANEIRFDDTEFADPIAGDRVTTAFPVSGITSAVRVYDLVIDQPTEYFRTILGESSQASNLPGNDFGTYSPESHDSTDPDYLEELKNAGERTVANNFGGLFIDDIVIGVADRGENVGYAPGTTAQSSANPSTALIDNPFFEPDFGTTIMETVTGPYQLEMRLSQEYSQPDGSRSRLELNERVSQSVDLLVNNDAIGIGEGDSFTLSNGVDSLVFEFDTDGAVSGTRIPVSITAEMSAGEVADAVISTINQAVVRDTLGITAVTRSGVLSSENDNSIAIIGRVSSSVDGDLNFGPNFTVINNGDDTFEGFDVGDVNRHRDQGQVIIDSNLIAKSLGVGINVDAGPIGPLGPFAATSSEGPRPKPGAPINSPVINTLGQIPGVVIQNNVLYDNGTAGIIVSGDDTTNGAPSPFARVLNNTVYGSTTGIEINDGASPTLLNNVLIANSTALNVSGGGQTIVRGSVYLNNGSNGNLLGTEAIVNPAGPQIVNPVGDPYNPYAGTPNPYPSDSSQLIDSAVESQIDRAGLVAVKNALGLPQSPIIVTNLDLSGQVRGDDPDINNTSGSGENIVIDRGALDRSDLIGPTAMLAVPMDNDPDNVDVDPNLNVVQIQEGRLQHFEISVVDENGIGVDASSVTSNQIVLTENGRLLKDGVDYTLGYSIASDTVRLTPLAGEWRSDSAYRINLNNRPRLVDELPAGNAVNDGDSFTITDSNGNVQNFEFNSGYLLGVDAANIAENDVFTFTIDGAVKQFEFTSGALTQTGSTNTVAFTAGDDSATIAASIADAFNAAQFGFKVTAIENNQVHIGGLAGNLIDVSPTAGLTVSGSPNVSAGAQSVPFIPGDSFSPTDMASQVVAAVTESGLTTTTLNHGGRLFFDDATSVAGFVGGVSLPAIVDLAGNPLAPNSADGETEFAILMPDVTLDFGDAPSSYQTDLNNNGARHTRLFVDQPILGSLIDSESDSAGTGTDDTIGVDDEDGVQIGSVGALSGVFLDPFASTPTVLGFFNPSATDGSQLAVNVFGNGLLDGWVDFNGDGDFDDANEQVLTNASVTDGLNVLTVFTPANPGVLSGGGDTAPTQARFRLSQTGNQAFSGVVIGGEVEDFSVIIADAQIPVANDDSGADYTVNEIDTSSTSTPSMLLSVGDNDTIAPSTNPQYVLEPGGTVSNGTLTLDPVTGEVTYTPVRDFYGTDTFSYRIVAEQVLDGVVFPVRSEPATVTITVNPVNEAPLVTEKSFRALENSDALATATVIDSADLLVGATPQTVVELPFAPWNEAVQAATLSVIQIEVFDNTGATQPIVPLSTPGDVFSIADGSYSGLSHYDTGSGFEPNGRLTVTVAGGEVTQVSFSQSAADGTDDVNRDTATGMNNSNVQFFYTIADSGVTIDPDTGASTTIDRATYRNSTASTIELLPRNDSPVANDDTIGANGVTSGPILLDPVFEDHASLLGSDYVIPAAFALLNDQGGSDDSVDENNLINEAGVTLQVTQFPIITQEGGRVTLSTGGDLVYVPAIDFFGTDSFDYTIVDNGSNFNADGTPAANTQLTSTARITLVVNPVNDQPTANFQQFVVIEDADDVAIPVDNLLEDSVAHANAITGPPFNEINQTLYVSSLIIGSTVVDFNNQNDGPFFTANGLGELKPVFTMDPGNPNDPGRLVSLTYSPTTNYNRDNGGLGLDSFGFVVSDTGINQGLPGVGSATATATITVVPTNDNPEPQDDTFAGTEGTTLQLRQSDFLVNDVAGFANLNNDPNIFAATDEINGTNGNDGALTILRETIITSLGGQVSFASNGDLIYEPPATVSGQDTFEYRVVDSGVSEDIDGVRISDPLQGIATVTINLAPVNDPPSLAQPNPVTMDEDAPARVVVLDGLSAGPGEDQPIRVTVSSSNPTLFADPIAQFDVTDLSAVQTFDLLPLPNQSGIAMITVEIFDGGADLDLDTPADNSVTVRRTFIARVNPVNDAPTLDAFQPLTIGEGTINEVVSLSGITAGLAESGQDLIVTVASSNSDLINPDNVVVDYTSPATDGTLTITPEADQFGTVEVLVTVTDAGLDNDPTTTGDNESTTQTLTVTVTPENDAPSFDLIPAQSTDEDSGEQTISISGVSAGPNEALSPNVLSFGVFAANTNLIEMVSVDYVDGETVATLTYTPVAEQSGESDIVVTLTDDEGATYDQTFAVTVVAVNDPPTVQPILDQSTLEDSMEQSILIEGISAGGNEQQTLIVTAAVDDPTLIDNISVEYNSPDSQGTIRYTPAAQQNGSTIVTLTVNDGETGGVTTESFTVTVQADNDPPSIDGVPTFDVDEDAGEQAVVFTGVSAGPGENQPLSISVSSFDSSLLASATVDYVSPNSTGTLRVTPVANAFGEATVVLQVTDGGQDDDLTTTADNAQSLQTITVNITPVNDAPEIGDIADESIDEDSGDLNITLGGVSSGPGESDDILVTATSDNADLISDPTVAFDDTTNTYSLTLAPNADQFGTATITVRVEDGGEDGDLTTLADNTFVTTTFDVEVANVNDAPTAVDDTATGDEDSVIEITAAQLVDNDIDPDVPDAQTLTVILDPANAGGLQTITSALGATIEYNPASGRLTYDPTTSAQLDELNVNETLEDSFSYTVSDGVTQGSDSSAIVRLIISGRNDAPTVVDDLVDAPELPADPSTLPPIVIRPLDNDFDVDGELSDDIDGLTITVEPQFGSLAKQLFTNDAGEIDIEIAYTPFSNFTGNDSFNYTIDDDSGQPSQQATVTIQSNRQPVTGPDVAGGVAEDGFNIDVLANDQPVEGSLDLASLTIVTQGQNGTATVEADGTISYEPDAGFTGTDFFEYTIADTAGNVSNPVRVDVSVVESGMQNPIRFGDVNANGEVTALDALLIVNRLGDSSSETIPVSPSDRGPNFYDVNGSQTITALDALLVINNIGTTATVFTGDDSGDGSTGGEGELVSQSDTADDAVASFQYRLVRVRSAAVVNEATQLGPQRAATAIADFGSVGFDSTVGATFDDALLDSIAGEGEETMEKSLSDQAICAWDADQV